MKKSFEVSAETAQSLSTRTFVVVFKDKGTNAIQVSMPAAEMLALLSEAPIANWDWDLDVLPLSYNLPYTIEDLRFPTPFLQQIKSLIEEHTPSNGDRASSMVMIPRLAIHNVEEWIIIGISLGYQFPPCVKLTHGDGVISLDVNLNEEFEAASKGIQILFQILSAPNSQEGTIEYSQEEEN